MPDFRVALAKLTRKFELFISNIPDLNTQLQMQLLQSAVNTANCLVGLSDVDKLDHWSNLIKTTENVHDVLLIIQIIGMLSDNLSKMCNTIGTIISARIEKANTLAIQTTNPNIPKTDVIEALKKNTLYMFVDIGNALKMLKRKDPSFFKELGGPEQQNNLDEIFNIMQNAAGDVTTYNGPEPMNLNSMSQTTDNTAIWNVLSRLTTMMDKQEKRRY